MIGLQKFLTFITRGHLRPPWINGAGQLFCIPHFSRVGRNLIVKAFCLYAPFSSLMNQWVFQSLSPIDSQHEMCLVVFRSHQQEQVSFLLLHISEYQKMLFLSFSFCRQISPSFRSLPVNFTLIYCFHVTLIALACFVRT